MLNLWLFCLVAVPAESAEFGEAVRAAFLERNREMVPRAALVAETRAQRARNFLVVRGGGELPAPPWGSAEAYAEALSLVLETWRRHQPEVRTLIVFSTFAEGGEYLFYLPLANDVRGLGTGQAAAIFDDTPGSPLEGLIWMGSLELLRTAGDDFLRERFIHELAHRYGVYLRLVHPRLPEDALLGRDRQHYSYFAETAASPLEGNRWHGLKGGRYESDASRPRPLFSPLDLYLLGVRPPKQVPPFLVLRDASTLAPPGMAVHAATPPASESGLSVTVAAEAEEVRIEQVIAGSGHREPAASETAPPWQIGVVLLARGVGGPSPEVVAAFAQALDALAEDFAYATGGRLELALDTVGAPPAPLGARCGSDEDCDPASSDRCLSTLAGGTCSRPCGAGCGPGACCPSSGPASGLCAPARACEILPPQPSEVRPDAGTGPNPAPTSDTASGCRATGGANLFGLLALGALLGLSKKAYRLRR